jgi:hypothetical protein
MLEAFNRERVRNEKGKSMKMKRELEEKYVGNRMKVRKLEEKRDLHRYDNGEEKK